MNTFANTTTAPAWVIYVPELGQLGPYATREDAQSAIYYMPYRIAVQAVIRPAA